MITQRALKTFGFIVNMLAICHSIPFKWETSSNKIAAAKSRFHLIAWKFSLALHTFYALHNGFRVFGEISAHHKDYLELTVTIVWGFVELWCVMIMLNGLSKMEDMVKVFNAVVDMDNKLQRKQNSHITILCY